MLELKPFRREDFLWLIEKIDTTELLLSWGGTRMDFPLDEAQLDKIFAESLGAEPSSFPFKAVDAAMDEMVGYIEIQNIERLNNSATLGRVLIGDEVRRGAGLGAQMVGLALRYGFEKLGLHRIDLFVWDFNERAVACYEKTGFKREGVIRDARRFRDKYLNLVQMSVLEEEWRANNILSTD